jgi:transcriptional regulator GlxA family with amidase domain
MMPAMQIAILIFDKLTALDAVGPYEVLRSVPGWEVKFVGLEKGQVRTDSGALGLSADFALEEVSEADIVLVPGGEGNRPLLSDDAVLSWLRQIDAGSRWTTSVCTGSLVLAAAGLLDGRRATSHWLYLEQLRELGADPLGGRFVEDGKMVTAAGVSAGIDMALHLVGREAGPEVAQAIQLGIEYDPQPPFDAGSPAKAPAPIVAAVTAIAAAGDEWLGARARD